MAKPGPPLESFGLVCSDGSRYNIGIENALRVCHGLLRPVGDPAFTDAVWREENQPPDVKASFDMDYPTMGRGADILVALINSGFSPIRHFTLPDEAWWDDLYTLMEMRIGGMRGKYADDGEVLSILDQLAQEPTMHRRHSDCYACEFFIARSAQSVQGGNP